jgi:hypothetical protein
LATRAWQAARLGKLVAGEPEAPPSGKAADALRELEALAGQSHATQVVDRKNELARMSVEPGRQRGKLEEGSTT